MSIHLAQVLQDEERWDNARQGVKILAAVGDLYGDRLAPVALGDMYNRRHETQKSRGMRQAALGKLHPDSVGCRRLTAWLAASRAVACREGQPGSRQIRRMSADRIFNGSRNVQTRDGGKREFQARRGRRGEGELFHRSTGEVSARPLFF
jgi:hypothetical protein